MLGGEERAQQRGGEFETYHSTCDAIRIVADRASLHDTGTGTGLLVRLIT